MNEPTATERQRDEARVLALSDAPGTRNRRAHARYAVELDVSLSSDHNFYAGFTENMSAGGIFVATHALKPVGSVIEFRIFLPDHGGAIEGKGQVRWVRPYNEQSNVPPGMGVAFVDLEPGSEETIRSFLNDRDPIFYDD